ncbi:MAG: hypothetical protein RID09_12705 [Coleofasciculus sp. G1-WW12-02]|uniref:hypothetical protein n=1 Tax=Coleofasciculus sp. G1-WW12-02 TaxID=3068483 RepID=UPI0032F382E0
MKLRLIALAMLGALPLFLSLSFSAEANEPNQPCQAYLDTSHGIDAEENNCPITVGDFSIRGTFSNSNWRVSFWAWEPAYYILYVEKQQDGTTINLTGFEVTGTTSRPQYRFTNPDRDVTYLVTFRYSDPDTIRLEIYQKNRLIANELLPRESGELIGGP